MRLGQVLLVDDLLDVALNQELVLIDRHAAHLPELLSVRWRGRTTKVWSHTDWPRPSDTAASLAVGT